MGLAALMALHFIYAFILSYQNYRARGRQRYAVNERPEGVSWASKNMLAIGVVVLFGLAFHLYDFWAKMQLAEIRGNAPVDGIDQIKFIFSNNYFSVMYLLWLVAIWFHLSHGIASVMQSIGWNNHVWPRDPCAVTFDDIPVAGLDTKRAFIGQCLVVYKCKFTC